MSNNNDVISVLQPGGLQVWRSFLNWSWGRPKTVIFITKDIKQGSADTASGTSGLKKLVLIL